MKAKKQIQSVDQDIDTGMMRTLLIVQRVMEIWYVS